MERQKRVLAVHDLSGVGKCSLTVALPILSAAGIECCALPTAILSTHTGGFQNFTYRDLTDDLLPMMRHWQSLNLKFDAIYTGYLGSFAQIDLIKKCFHDFDFAHEKTLLAIDPVMGDNGKLYPAFDESFPPAMKKLCSQANLIMPNLTEATRMLGLPYQEGPYEEKYIEKILLRLAEETNGPKIVLTGVYFDEKKLGAGIFDDGKIDFVLGEKISGNYHGTGDMFGSALVGALVHGKSLKDATQITIDFLIRAIRWTYHAKTDFRYGVNFEEYLAQYRHDLDQ